MENKITANDCFLPAPGRQPSRSILIEYSLFANEYLLSPFVDKCNLNYELYARIVI